MRPAHAIKFTENACRATITDYGKDNVALAHTHTHAPKKTHTLFSELLKSLVMPVMDKIITLISL